MHPASPPHAPALTLGRPPYLVELPSDTAWTVVDAIVAGVFARHPRLRMIVAHCGGALPALYDDTALCGSASVLVPTLDLAGAGHVLDGSGSGAASDDVVATNLAGLKALALGREQRDGIARERAQRLFPRLA